MTADLASSWQKALAEWVPHARVVFDRFHVEQLASDAVDEVRRSEQRRLDPADAKALKGTRYVLLKHPARLKPSGPPRHNLRAWTWVYSAQSLTNHGTRNRTFSHGAALVRRGVWRCCVVRTGRWTGPTS